MHILKRIISRDARVDSDVGDLDFEGLQINSCAIDTTKYKLALRSIQN